MDYFEQIIKHYLLLALRNSGANVDRDVHTEIDDAFIELRDDIRWLGQEIVALRHENASLSTRVTNLSAQIADQAIALRRALSSEIFE